jgi:hypothetical protein
VTFCSRRNKIKDEDSKKRRKASDDDDDEVVGLDWNE